MKNKHNWAIIPAYNEGNRINAVIENVKPFVDRIVVVDDGSSDKTVIKTGNNVVLLRHIVNMGKGAAVKTGSDYAIKNGAQKLVYIDADGQHDPKLIPSFMKSLETSDIVFGYRHLNQEMPGVLRFGNRFINYFTQILYGIKLKDTQCGYRAMSSAVYKKIKWRANDYSMESEMIANVGKLKLSYAQIPVPTVYNDRYKGTTVLDGFKIVFNMIMWRLMR